MRYYYSYARLLGSSCVVFVAPLMGPVGLLLSGVALGTALLETAYLTGQYVRAALEQPSC